MQMEKQTHIHQVRNAGSEARAPFNRHAFVAGHGFVVEVPVGEVAAGLGEGGKIGEALHGGDAGECSRP